MLCSPAVSGKVMEQILLLTYSALVKYIGAAASSSGLSRISLSEPVKFHEDDEGTGASVK